MLTAKRQIFCIEELIKIKIPFADKTITLFCAYKGETENGSEFTYWVKRIFKNCFVTKNIVSEIFNSVTINTGETLIQIPINDDYLTPQDFFKSSVNTSGNTAISSNFTVNKGDYIVVGEICENVEIGSTMKEILNKHDAVKITSVTVQNYPYVNINYIEARGQ